MLVKSISIFGLGKLGATTLAVYASKGFKVIGVDINPENINAINSGKSPVYEPGVTELIKEYKNNILATENVDYAIDHSDLSFIIVPTPSVRSGYFSTEYVLSVIKNIGESLKTKNSHHTILLVSTVCPGSTDNIIEILENISEKTCNEDFSFIYSPDFIALGSIIKDILNPDLVLIGESNKKAGDIYEEIINKVVENKPQVHRMSIKNAELCKISINSYLVMKINFANIISEICENMPTGDASKVLGAIGADTRINKKYLKPGLASAGPCLPRDSRAFKYAANNYGVIYNYSTTSDIINEYHRKNRITRILIQELSKQNTKKISILGITYKPDVSVTEKSVPLKIAEYLAKKKFKVSIHDPAGLDEAKRNLKKLKIEYCDIPQMCLRDTRVCFVATDWKVFQSITEQDFITEMGEGATIFDAWGIYENTPITRSEKLNYIQIGKSRTKEIDNILLNSMIITTSSLSE